MTQFVPVDRPSIVEGSYRRFVLASLTFSSSKEAGRVTTTAVAASLSSTLRKFSFFDLQGIKKSNRCVRMGNGQS